MSPTDRFQAAYYAGHGIQLEYDRASDTYRLGPDAIAEVEREAVDGTNLCLIEAAELHRKGELGKAHRLQLLVHLRGCELGSDAMRVAALNICRDANGCEPARASKAAS